MMTGAYSPKIIIDYERTAYIDPVLHIRITIDRNIQAAWQCSNFLSGSYSSIPILSSGKNILEVKFDEILPGWLKQLLESVHIQQSTFSKYYLGRKCLEGVLR